MAATPSVSSVNPPSSARAAANIAAAKSLKPKSRPRSDGSVRSAICAAAAAAAQMADLTLPSERGRLFGFNDFAAAMFAAALALLGGLTLETLGVAAMAIGAAILVTAPAPWILGRREPVPP